MRAVKYITLVDKEIKDEIEQTWYQKTSFST